MPDLETYIRRNSIKRVYGWSKADDKVEARPWYEMRLAKKTRSRYAKSGIADPAMFSADQGGYTVAMGAV